MPADTMDPTTAVTYGPFIQAAEAQYSSDPGQVNPATITNMPAGYTLVRTIQMTDFLGPEQSRVFYGYVATGGDPATAVVALRGTESTMEWWDDFHWDLVPFTQIPDGGNVAQGFYDIYQSIGTMAPGQQGTSAPSAFAAEVARAATTGLAAGLDPASLPLVVTGHSLGGALATLLVTNLNATTALKPQAWTFASPHVGDATFAARYGGLSTVSWRIYNQVDVVPYFPMDISNNYQPVTTGYAINSLGKAKWSLSCAHSLNTYMHVLSPGTVPLDQACTLWLHRRQRLLRAREQARRPCRCPADQGRSLIDRTRAYCGGMDNEQAFPVIRQTVLDTTDPRRLAEFYRQLFGLRYRPGDEPPGPGQPDPKGQDWLVLTSPAGGAGLAFAKVGELSGATWPDGPVPQQLHLDTTVSTKADLDVQHDRAVALGARLLEDRSDDPEEPLRVYADPAGHPFCIFVG